LSERLDTVGPLAQDVRVAALMLAAIMGRDADDPSTHHDRHMRPEDVLDRLEDGVAGMRIGRFDPGNLMLATDEVKADYEASLKRLQEAGASIAACRLPERFDTYQGLVGKMAAVEGYGNYKHYADDAASGLAEPVRERMLGGKGISTAQIEEMDERRRNDMRNAPEIFEGFDAIVLPTAPFPAIPVSEVDESAASYALYTRWVNYLGFAGLAVPTALSKDGMPMSLQIVVRRFDDPLALRIGRAFEQARGAFPKPPL
jgi:aspartyl-tRNA(Asn)/glutamyl-tRNA(Gln) amidotransferase subunit A